MCEEFRRGAELNDAELESASGGDQFLAAISDAQQLCRICPLYCAKACNQESHLAQYLLARYPNKIHEYTECPYYK